MPVPLLIISDAVTAGTGLARITKDLATRIAANLPEFRVGTCGYGGAYSRHLPFPQYEVPTKDWVIHDLPQVWQDFAGDEKGIVLSIWDATRLLWLSQPESYPGLPRSLVKFLKDRPFRLWGYFPIDATGPNNKLTAFIKYVILGYDRVLAYSQWAMDILARTLSVQEAADRDLDWRPHGIDTTVFNPKNRVVARHGFGKRLKAGKVKSATEIDWITIPDDTFLVGIVATNQTRKDWGLGISTVAELAKERKVFVWCHTDDAERHWSLPALLNDFGLLEKALITTETYSDEVMAWSYSACDVTLGIGLGEGFGYPIFESLACGCPCIHGNYGGAAEHLTDSMLVWPSVPRRLESVYNCYREVHDPKDWAHVINRLPEGLRYTLPPHLYWASLWPNWADWFKRGLK